MSQPRRIMPLPLGGEHGLPYSRGLMARALMAVGVAPDRASKSSSGYVSARREMLAEALADAGRERPPELETLLHRLSRELVGERP